MCLGGDMKITDKKWLELATVTSDDIQNIAGDMNQDMDAGFGPDIFNHYKMCLYEIEMIGTNRRTQELIYLAMESQDIITFVVLINEADKASDDYVKQIALHLENVIEEMYSITRMIEDWE